MKKLILVPSLMLLFSFADRQPPSVNTPAQNSLIFGMEADRCPSPFVIYI